MAIDIYSISAMSAEPERVFSGAKRTISDSRGSLKSETIEVLECLSHGFDLESLRRKIYIRLLRLWRKGLLIHWNFDLDY